MVEPGES